MKTLKLFLLASFISLVGFSQSKLNEGFDNLVNKTWFTQGEWENGTPFSQEVTIKYGLKKTIVITNTKSIIIEEKMARFGESAHGVRKFNSEKDEVEFWEFNVQGDILTGRVIVEGKNICYKYQYGEETVSDLWQYVDDNTYKLTVGIYNDGKWEKKYLVTEMKGKSIKK